jgi:gliding motility-associated-like protein
MNRLSTLIVLVLMLVQAIAAKAELILDSLDIIEADTIIQESKDCQAETEVCLEVVFQQLRNYEILVDGEPYEGRFPACNIDTIYKANFDNIVEDAQAPYELLFFEVAGDTFMITFNSFEELVDSIRTWDPTSDWKYDSLNNEMFSVNPPQVLFSNMIRFRDANNNTTALTIDRTFAANGTFFFFERGWNEVVFNDTIMNCTDTVDIGISCPQIDTTRLFVEWMIRDTFCFESLDLLANITEINQLQFISGNNIELIEEDSCLIYKGLEQGSDTLVYKIQDELNLCDTHVVIIEVGEMPDGDNTILTDTIFPNQIDTVCPDFAFEVDSISNICPASSEENVSFIFDTATQCLIYTYVFPGIDSFCLETHYDNGIVDTFTLIVTALSPLTDTIIDSIFLNQNIQYCFELDELSEAPFQINEFCNLTPQFIDYSIDSSALCLNYSGQMLAGSDTICIEICDNVGVCDTTIFYITTIDNERTSEFIFDSLLINFTDTICLNYDLPGMISDIQNLCPDSLNTNFSFDIDSSELCIYYQSNALGMDTACILFTDEFGNTDTNYIVLKTLLPTIDTVFDSVEFLERDSFCLDSTELAGNLISIENYCPENSGTQVEFVIHTMNYCIHYSGVTTGLDTACLVICDDFGICDTTILIIETGDLPDGQNSLITDTVFTNQIDSFCFDPRFEPIVDIVDICDTLNGNHIQYSLNSDSSCIIYEYISDGVDTACYVTTYENGIRDTFTIIVTALSPKNDTIIDTIFLGSTETYCIPLNELTVPIDSIEEFCNDSLEFIIVSPLDSILCFDVTAEFSGGTDTLCFAYCDTMGICDTAIYYITVENTFDTSEFISDSILVNFTDTICFDNDLPGAITSIENICSDGNGFVEFELDTVSNCLYYSGIAIGVDTACILITDEFGNTDTNYIEIRTILPTADTTILTIPVGITDTFCLDTDELAGAIGTMINLCPDLINDDVEAMLIPGQCVEYTGINAGESDTMCILICDDFGVCDTSYIIFIVEIDGMDGRDSLIRDTVLINFTETICLDTLSNLGMVINFYNACPESSDNVEFILDPETYCISYTGDSLGLDTACIVIEYENGPRDSFTLIVDVVPPSPDTIELTINIDETVAECLDYTELAGLPDDTAIIDICTDLNGEHVEYVINFLNFCIDFSGVSEGSDTVCIVFCDNLNVCDTTTYIINVIDTTTGPMLDLIAINDFDTLMQGDIRFIDVLNNDTIPDNNLTFFGIVDDPLNGMAQFDSSGIVIYTPDVDFCGIDSFTYEICNDFDCDSATVTVFIECMEEEILFIPQGFSPNGDGVGDLWEIQGINTFPNTNVEIYNRWGNRVFQSNDYQNDWDGSWEGNPLPDGTYFYMIDFRNGDKPRTGYVVILR